VDRRPKGLSLHHRRFDLRPLDSFAAAVLLSIRRLAERKKLSSDLAYTRFGTHILPITARLLASIGDETPVALPPTEIMGAVQMLKRNFKQFEQLEQRLTDEANRLREQAKGMSLGLAGDQLLHKAQEAAIAAAVSEWLRSPGPKNRLAAGLR
jgi:hypothetical protein